MVILTLPVLRPSVRDRSRGRLRAPACRGRQWSVIRSWGGTAWVRGGFGWKARYVVYGRSSPETGETRGGGSMWGSISCDAILSPDNSALVFPDRGTHHRPQRATVAPGDSDRSVTGRPRPRPPLRRGEGERLISLPLSIAMGRGP